MTPIHNLPSSEIKDRIIELAKKGLGNEEIVDRIAGEHPNVSLTPGQIAGIVFRAKIKRKKKKRTGLRAKKASKAEVILPVQPAPIKQEEEVAVVYWLRFYKRLGLLTREEAGVLLGKADSQLADICDQYDIVRWHKVPDMVMRKRTCCFPLTARSNIKTLLCCAATDPEDGFVCKEHAESKIPLC
ncbi:MAG TPA: hypothetical protein VN665_00670 [Candidatus Paceibacterota bacterium]|nr:hypothetical protein [Candidatus Paceibacterota bacterium]